MTSHLDYFVGLAVAAYLFHRARSLPSLRPASLACLAFCILDAARLAGLPPWLDVVAFVVMPGCWGALLSNRRWTWPAGLLAYALLLLLARRHPAVASHWQAWLAAPRLAVGAWALLLALQVRGRPVVVRREGSELTPRPAEGVAKDGGSIHDVSRGVDKDAGNEVRGDDAEEAHWGRLPPSTRIGIILALAAAASVIGGLWSDWPGVRLLSMVAWGIVAGVAAISRRKPCGRSWAPPRVRREAMEQGQARP